MHAVLHDDIEGAADVGLKRHDRLLGRRHDHLEAESTEDVHGQVGKVAVSLVEGFVENDGREDRKSLFGIAELITKGRREAGRSKFLALSARFTGTREVGFDDVPRLVQFVSREFDVLTHVEHELSPPLNFGIRIRRVKAFDEFFDLRKARFRPFGRQIVPGALQKSGELVAEVRDVLALNVLHFDLEVRFTLRKTAEGRHLERGVHDLHAREDFLAGTQDLLL